MGNLHRTNSVRCGSSYPYFSPHNLVNLVVVCGLNLRERILFSLRGLIAKIQESYPANESVVIQKGGREIPSWVAREHRATTIPNEMRHVERVRAVAVQLSSEMTDG